MKKSVFPNNRNIEKNCEYWSISEYFTVRIDSNMKFV